MRSLSLHAAQQASLGSPPRPTEFPGTVRGQQPGRRQPRGPEQPLTKTCRAHITRPERGAARPQRATLRRGSESHESGHSALGRGRVAGQLVALGGAALASKGTSATRPALPTASQPSPSRPAPSCSALVERSVLLSFATTRLPCPLCLHVLRWLFPAMCPCRLPLVFAASCPSPTACSSAGSCPT